MSPTDQPLRKDAERNRQRILDAARELFAERGLGVTLNDVAHHAGVGVGTVYRRFPDKELLIDTLFQEQLDEWARIYEEGLDDPDRPFRAVFIRAPWVERLGDDVEVLARADGHPVAVRHGRLLATSFHPEVTDDHRVHELFVRMVDGRS